MCLGSRLLCTCLHVVGIFRSNSLFIGSNVRGSVNEGRADFTPIFLSEVPLLFRRKILNLDVALIQVSPPDSHGFCTLGPSVDTTRAAIQNAKFIVGQSLCIFISVVAVSIVKYFLFSWQCLLPSELLVNFILAKLVLRYVLHYTANGF